MPNLKNPNTMPKTPSPAFPLRAREGLGERGLIP